MTLVIKNTFLHLTAECEDGTVSGSTSARRSKSTPPDWRSTKSCGQAISEISTPTCLTGAASDDKAELGERRASGELSDCDTVLTWSDQSAEIAGSHPPKVVLSLQDHVNHKRTALVNHKARAFTPSGLPLGEAGLVVMALRQALSTNAGITNVEMSKGGCAGSTIAFIAQTAKGVAARPIIDAAKSAIFASTALSSTVYLMGYLTNPFQDRYEVRCTGFKVTLGFVPRAMEDSVCWDTIQKGFCPRRSTCRWCHPSESELVKISVMVLTQ